jgi:hypothetical protein
MSTLAASLGRDRRVLNGALFLVLAFTYWACVRRYLPYDGDMMVRVTRSLVMHHSFRIQDPVLHLNEPYAFYGLAVSLLLVPLFAAGQWLFSDGTILLTAFEPIVTALTVVVLMNLLVNLGASWRRAMTVALIYGFASLAWAYSGVLYSEPLVGLCTVSSLLFLRYYERDGAWRWLLFGGAAAALGLLARWDSALLVVVPITGYVVYGLLSPHPALPRKRGRECDPQAGEAFRVARRACRRNRIVTWSPASPASLGAMWRRRWWARATW